MIMAKQGIKESMAKIAFIGIGVMGGPMAGHLVKAGHELTVYNRLLEVCTDSNSL